jgi:hypothetical protein
VGEALCRFRMPDGRSFSGSAPHALESGEVACAPSPHSKTSPTSRAASRIARQRFGVRLWAKPSAAFACRTGAPSADQLPMRSECGDSETTLVKYLDATPLHLHHSFSSFPWCSSFTPDLYLCPRPVLASKGTGKRWEVKNGRRNSPHRRTPSPRPPTSCGAPARSRTVRDANVTNAPRVRHRTLA